MRTKISCFHINDLNCKVLIKKPGIKKNQPFFFFFDQMKSRRKILLFFYNSIIVNLTFNIDLHVFLKHASYWFIVIYF